MLELHLRMPFLKRHTTALFAVILALGLAIRLVDLDDLPLDFHPTRQLRSALIARGMYYQSLPDAPEWQRQTAFAQWQGEQVIEPPLMEWLVAFTYGLIGDEVLWVGRVYAAIFWTLGAAGVLLLSRDMVSADGALGAAALYLFSGYSVIASRSFQPDSLMVACLAIALWAAYRWHRHPSYQWALAAGLLAGMGMFVKAVSVFILAGGFAGLVWSHEGLSRAVRNRQVWLMGFAAATPPLVYQVYGMWVGGFLDGQWIYRFFPSMWLNPGFYVAWVLKIDASLGVFALLLALLGSLLFLQRAGAQRGLVIGLWAGYLVYGMALPYHISSHDYYHLPLFVVAALSVAPLAEIGLRSLVTPNARKTWVQVAISVILLFGLANQLWLTRLELKQTDYRPQAGFWQELGDRLRPYRTIALIQDYGYSLAYWGWYNAAYWPTLGDFRLERLAGRSQSSFSEMFERYTSGMDFFLITNLDELARQPDLKNYLASQYERVEADQASKGFLLYDLRQPKQ